MRLPVIRRHRDLFAPDAKVLNDEAKTVRRLIPEGNRIVVAVGEDSQCARTYTRRSWRQLLHPDILEQHRIDILKRVEAEKGRADPFAAPIGDPIVGQSLAEIRRSCAVLVHIASSGGDKGARPILALGDVSGVDDINSIDGDVACIALIPAELDDGGVISLPDYHPLASYVAVVGLNSIVAHMVENVPHVRPRVHLDAVRLAKERADLFVVGSIDGKGAEIIAVEVHAVEGRRVDRQPVKGPPGVACRVATPHFQRRVV